MKSEFIASVGVWIILVLFVVMMVLDSHMYNKTKDVCDAARIITENEDLLGANGVYTTNGLICFRENKHDVLFHEMAHAEINKDYEHFCVQLYE